MALLSEAAAAYALTEERAELVDVDLRVAEVLLLQGAADVAAARLAETEALLRDALRRAGVLSPGEALMPTPQAVGLLRLQGCAAGQLGDRGTARELLDASVSMARRLGTAHELALSLQASAWLGGPGADEAGQLLQGLGVLAVPALPRTSRRLPAPRVRTSSPSGLPGRGGTR
jgi:hypothetical protein